MYREISCAAALSLATASCGAPSCGRQAQRTQARASAPTPPGESTHAAKAVLEPCALEIDGDREATRDELIGLLLPAFRSGQLPVRHPEPTSDRPDIANVFLLQPCRGDAMESLSAPAIGELQRLPLGDGRELVQFPVGTKQGIDEYTLGVLAILGREGRTLRALSVTEAAADLPGALTPFRLGHVGGERLLLRSEATSPASEDWERGNYVSADYLKGNELRLAGVMWEQRSSDDTFWQGAYAWQMTSPGVEPTETGYVVHEHWSFTHRKTQRRSTRDVQRLYTLADHRLVASPLDDLDAWPETRFSPKPQGPAPPGHAAARPP